ALVRADTAIREPGVFRYGNNDYILLGAIIERLVGEPFAEAMHRDVFRPAGMAESGFDVWPRPHSLAHGYTTPHIRYTRYAGADANAPRLQSNDAILPHVGVPGAVAYTTAPDLMHFADALLRHTLLSRSATEELIRGRVDTSRSAANQSFGYGFFVGQAD